MPKPYTFPTLYNEVPQLSISKLKEWGYLDKEQIKHGVLTWSKNGFETASISVTVSTHENARLINLNYSHNGTNIDYAIRLITMPSNLGKGEVWYFLCPNTKKRARILYLVGGHFLHRDAFNGCMYDTQTYSKRTREMIRRMDADHKATLASDQINSKHFKKYYNGKRTKRHLRLLEQMDVEPLGARQIEMLYLT